MYNVYIKIKSFPDEHLFQSYIHRPTVVLLYCDSFKLILEWYKMLVSLDVLSVPAVVIVFICVLCYVSAYTVTVTVTESSLYMYQVPEHFY